MPKRDKKSKQEVSSKSSKSKDSESSVSKKSCKDDKCKKLECKRKIKVDTDLIPEVKCDEIKQCDAFFDVAMKLKHTPTCEIIPLKQEKISDCENVCVFRVKVKSDIKCKPEIVCSQPFDTAEFNLDVKAKTKTRCREEGGKH